MANLAIKGHLTRGKEVIEILEMLGGVNAFNLEGTETQCFCYIFKDNNKIYYCWSTNAENVIVYTIEEFEEKFPYKVGDKVRIPEYESEVRIISMNWDGYEVQYEVFIDESEWYSAEELNNWNKEEFMKEPKELLIGFIKDKDGNMVLNTHKDYEIKEVDGKFMLLKKKPQYPKTYEECCKVLNTYCTMPSRPGYKEGLIAKFQELLICRDAYWKIAGEHMGLGKSWEPDFGNDLLKYYISFHNNKIDKGVINYSNKILAFPTEEMRDAFYENFNEEIEMCKELL